MGEGMVSQDSPQRNHWIQSIPPKICNYSTKVRMGGMQKKHCSLFSDQHRFMKSDGLKPIWQSWTKCPSVSAGWSSPLSCCAAALFFKQKDQRKSRPKKNAYCKLKGGWNIAKLALLQYTDLYSSTWTQGHWEHLSLVSLPSSNHFTGEKDTWRVTVLCCLDKQPLLVFFHREKSLSHQHHYCLLYAYLASLKRLDWSARGSNLTTAYFTNKASPISSISSDIFAIWRNIVAWSYLHRTFVLEEAEYIICCLKYKMCTCFNPSPQPNIYL